MCNASKERISKSVYSARLEGWRLGRARISRSERGPPDASNLAYLRSSTANSQVRSGWVFFSFPVYMGPRLGVERGYAAPVGTDFLGSSRLGCGVFEVFGTVFGNLD